MPTSNSLAQLQARALEIRSLFDRRNLHQTGQRWTRQDLLLGFVGDVGDLAKLGIAHEGRRDIPDFQAKTAHELADCLWSLLVLADEYGVDLTQSFVDLCDNLQATLTAAGDTSARTGS